MQKLRSWLNLKQTSHELASLLLYPWGGDSESGIYVSPETAMRCSAVFACVGLLSESIAQLPIKFYKGRGKNREEVYDHWLYRLLYQRPSAWQTSFEWRETAMLHLCLRGNFYAYKVRDGSGRVAELLPLHPDAVSVRQLDNWDLEYLVTFQTGEQRYCTQRDIFHVAYRSLDGIAGLSPIAYQRETIGLTLAAQKHGAKTLSNGAKPGGVLTHPNKLSDESAKRLRESWETTYGGDNAGRTAILEEGMKFEVLSMNNSDAQYLETRRFQVEDIARIFGIPLFMIQSTEKTTSWGSGIEQMSMGYVRYTLLPCWWHMGMADCDGRSRSHRYKCRRRDNRGRRKYGICMGDTVMMKNKNDFGNMIQRLDGSYVIERNGMPYHIPVGALLFPEAEQYAQENPDRVTFEEPPEPATLEEAKKEKLKELADARYKAEVGGINFNGYIMHTDRESQGKYTGASVAYTTAGISPEQWKGIDGWLPIPDGDTLMTLVSAVMEHVNACFARESELSTKVNGARNIKEVNAVSW